MSFYMGSENNERIFERDKVTKLLLRYYFKSYR